jgi:hypothetical protein
MCYGSRAWAEMVFGCLGVKDDKKGVMHDRS